MGAGYKTVGSVIRLARLGTGLFNQVNIGVGLLSTSHPMHLCGESPVARLPGLGRCSQFAPSQELAELVREAFLRT